MVVSIVIAILLFHAVIACFREDKARERRKATQRDLPRERLLPRHYKSFVEMERALWYATEDSQRTADWDRRKLKLRGAELQVVKEYVRGLEKDFEIGNRIFAVVVSQSPEVTVFRQLEWQRISKIELPYHGWHALIRLHLWTGRISPGELNKFTQVVATLAF